MTFYLGFIFLSFILKIIMYLKPGPYYQIPLSLSMGISVQSSRNICSGRHMKLEDYGPSMSVDTHSWKEVEGTKRIPSVLSRPYTQTLGLWRWWKVMMRPALFKHLLRVPFPHTCAAEYCVSDTVLGVSKKAACLCPHGTCSLVEETYTSQIISLSINGDVC